MKNLITYFLMFVLILLCDVSVFSQPTIKNSVSSVEEEIKTKIENSSSNLQFILWFMGSKQNPNSTPSFEGFNDNKNINTSGFAPNRLLIKTFLKKAISFETSLT